MSEKGGFIVRYPEKFALWEARLAARGAASGGVEARTMAFSSADMVALMNDTKLLMSSSVNGTVMQTGANRDADGTIDRSPPPTMEVCVILKELKRAIQRS